MPRRELRAKQVWLIGVPLNLLLAIPAAYPVALGMLAAQVLAGELGWVPIDPTVVDDGAGLIITLGVVSVLFTGLVVTGLNALFAFRAPQLKAGRYWLAVALLIVVPDVFYWTNR